MGSSTPAKTVKRNRDAEPKDSDTSTTTGNLKGKVRKILYIITSLANGDWNEFGPKKWEYLQKVNKNGTNTDIQCLWFVKSYKSPKEKYNGTYRTIDDPKTGKRDLVKVSDIAAWDALAVKQLVADHYEAGNTHLVIGTHGQGDYFWLDEYTEDGGKTYQQDAIPVRKIIREQFIGCHFLSAILDCCLMGELYTMKHFHAITPWVGCAEGFQWSEDKDLNGTMFSDRAALQLSNPDVNTYDALVATGKHFMATSDQGRNDFGIYFTPNAEALLSYFTGNPVYYKILQETSLQIITSHSTKYSKYVFSTVKGDPDTYDAQYLLDLWQIALDYPNDGKLVSLIRGVLWWHQGQTSGSGPNTPAQYNFQLSGLSITCAHTPARPKEPETDSDDDAGDDKKSNKKKKKKAAAGAAATTPATDANTAKKKVSPTKASPKKKVSPTKKGAAKTSAKKK